MLSLYLFLAVFFSFICSIAEAVILSVTPSYVALLQQKNVKIASTLAAMKADINRPLSAILTLNTIAHTVGAAGAGSEAAKIFGDAYVGVISAVLTLIILIFSEIIPKTLGARYWQTLTPSVTRFLKILTKTLSPFVYISEWITKGIKGGEKASSGPSRQEFSILAKLTEAEGEIDPGELQMITSLMENYQTSVSNIVTPRNVVFSIQADTTLKEYFDHHADEKFSRIPIYEEDHEHIVGFVLRSELLLAKAQGEEMKKLRDFSRSLMAIPSTITVAAAFRKLLGTRASIQQVIDEHGGLVGIVTMEDMVESILGLEIVDESDKVTDMQSLARRKNLEPT